jgi:3-dehydroquinate synthase
MTPPSTAVIQQTVRVELGERSYPIIIRRGLLRGIGKEIKRLNLGAKIAVVTDRNVARYYLKPFAKALTAAGFEVVPVVLQPGERTKSLRTVGTLMDELAKARFERKSTLVALGGGVIGDVSGFAAAIYQRGIPFIQVPTSLVAQVDSSVGGKTGVDHPMGKNLIGAFNQPRAVLIDPMTLKTLPEREWLAGLAEVIKYGVIADEAFFAYLEANMNRIINLDQDAAATIVKRSCEIKAEVVSKDEREADRRRILNFGHTVGHALESLGGYRSLIHGEAIAIGMVHEASLSRHLGVCDQETVDRIVSLVRTAGLPSALPRVTFSSLWGVMQSDKKVSGGTVYCVLPERIGAVRIVPLEREVMREWFQSAAAASKRLAAVATARKSG